MLRVLLPLLLLSCACSGPPPPAPLATRGKSFEKVIPGCGDKSRREEPCLSFRVVWVEVLPPFSATAEELKSPELQFALRRINTAIESRLQPPGAPPGLETEAAAFIAAYQEYRAASPAPDATWFLRRACEPLRSDSQIFTISCSEESFSGGDYAHSTRVYLNFRRTTGEPVTLETILNPGALPELTRLAQQRLQRSMSAAIGPPVEAGAEVKAEASIEADTPPAGQLRLGDNFAVTRAGLLFRFEPGPTDLLLHWKEITRLLRKNANIIPPPPPSRS